MNDKPVHNKYMQEPLPAPDVPADEAWQQMHQLLVQHNLTEEPNKNKRRWLLWICLLFMISTAGAITYLSFNKNLDLPEHKTVAGKKNIHPGNAEKRSTPETKSKQSFPKSTLVNDDNRHKKVKNFALPAKNDKFFTKKDKQDESAANADNSITIKSINYQERDTISLLNSKDANLSKQDKKITSSPAATDSIIDNNKSEVPANKQNKKTRQNRIQPEFGLQWNINFSLANNSYYFSSYNNKAHQYYMWLLPSLNAGVNFNNKQSLFVIINPYKQQFAGNKIVHVEKPWIASTEPDIVTRLIKSRGINLGLQYNHAVTKNLSVNIGGSYMFQQNILLLEQSVESASGAVVSEKMYGAHRKDAAFDYIEPSFLNGDASLQYNLKKLSIGAGITVPLKSISTEKQYRMQPVNGELFLRYRFK